MPAMEVPNRGYAPDGKGADEYVPDRNASETRWIPGFSRGPHSNSRIGAQAFPLTINRSLP